MAPAERTMGKQPVQSCQGSGGRREITEALQACSKILPFALSEVRSLWRVLSRGER